MANDIGSVIGRLGQNAQNLRNDARTDERRSDANSAAERSAGRAQQINDRILIQNQSLAQRQNAAADETSVQNDPRVISLRGAIDTATALEEILDEAAEVIEDLRAAQRAGNTEAAAALETEFYQTLDRFSQIIQDGGRPGNNLLTSDISRLQVDVPGQNEPFVIAGRNILGSTEDGGIFEQEFFSSRGELEVERLTQLVGAGSPVVLAELPEDVLAALQSVVAGARDSLSGLRAEETKNLNDLEQLLRTAQVIKESGEDTETINEERANLLALQTRLQLENIGGGIVEHQREDILQFFR